MLATLRTRRRGATASLSFVRFAPNPNPQVNTPLQEVLNAEAAAAAAAAAAGAAPSPADAFLLKEALRSRTSEEPDGWKLGSEVSTTP